MSVEDTKNINGRNTDTFARERISDIASDLCPIADNESRMAYAGLILDWVMKGVTLDARYARTQSVERAYQNHMNDVSNNRTPGMSMDRTMTWPEFRNEVIMILRFIGGQS